MVNGPLHRFYKVWGTLRVFIKSAFNIDSTFNENQIHFHGDIRNLFTWISLYTKLCKHAISYIKPLYTDKTLPHYVLEESNFNFR